MKDEVDTIKTRPVCNGFQNLGFFLSKRGREKVEIRVEKHCGIGNFSPTALGLSALSALSALSVT